MHLRILVLASFILLMPWSHLLLPPVNQKRIKKRWKRNLNNWSYGWTEFRSEAFWTCFWVYMQKFSSLKWFYYNLQLETTSQSVQAYCNVLNHAGRYAANKSAPSVWCYHVNMDLNLWWIFPPAYWIYGRKNWCGKKGIQPTTKFTKKSKYAKNSKLVCFKLKILICQQTLTMKMSKFLPMNLLKNPKVSGSQRTRSTYS